MPQLQAAFPAGHTVRIPSPLPPERLSPWSKGSSALVLVAFFCHGDHPTGSRGTSLPLHRGDGASLGSVLQSGIRKHSWDPSSRSVSKQYSHSLGAGKAGEGSASVVFSSRHLLVTPPGEQERARWGLVFSRRAAHVIC